MRIMKGSEEAIQQRVAVTIVVSMEEARLLLAVQRIVRGVHVRDHPQQLRNVNEKVIRTDHARVTQLWGNNRDTFREIWSGPS